MYIIVLCMQHTYKTHTFYLNSKHIYVGLRMKITRSLSPNKNGTTSVNSNKYSQRELIFLLASVDTSSNVVSSICCFVFALLGLIFFVHNNLSTYIWHAQAQPTGSNG